VHGHLSRRQYDQSSNRTHRTPEQWDNWQSRANRGWKGRGGKTVTIFVIQILNSFFYAAVLFLIAAGLSLIYGVMRIVNLAHGSLYALGAYVSAWIVGSAVGHALEGNLGLAGMLLLLPVGAIAIAAVGALIEPTLLRPLYRRSEEYHLLVTFGLLMILED